MTACRPCSKPPKRSDAQAHRALLLDAADHVFSHHGVHVALELVTEQAGVSRATPYRNFPDREALMAALLERAFSKLEVLAKQLDQSEDGLHTMLGHMAVWCPIRRRSRITGARPIATGRCRPMHNGACHA